jgi:UDP-N-acetylmuramoyl-L-alanyl-D-glutamate--2,6-diaminopimelate ligase
MENIFLGVEHTVLNQGKTRKYKEIEYDSRKIKRGGIFAALEGFNVDGHEFIDTAVGKGAAMIIVSKDVEIKNSDVTYIKVENLRSKLGIIASNFYDWPQRKMKIIGVTGTNGKTTTTYIIETIIGNCSRIGTIDYKIGDAVFPAPNTTPESLDIVKMCAKSLEVGIDKLVMEVSSHALELGRVDMLEFDTAVFTNLTQDHLDFHKTMENYFLAKSKLFEKVKKGNKSVINVDDKWGAELYEKNSSKSISYSLDTGNLTGRIVEYTNHDMVIDVVYKGDKYTFTTELMGKFNLYNILGAIGGALALGMEFEEIILNIKNAKKVPGRFETVNEKQDYMVVVDYAHTDDGLINILQALKELRKGKIVTIFGAGGDRDKTKRPKMAKAAAKYSDYIIVTSDNPRTEDPVKIIEDVVTGLKEIEFPNERYDVIEDREAAIAKAILFANKDDIILIAGKGHEDYQIIGKEKYHFDDREIARKYILQNREELI